MKAKKSYGQHFLKRPEIAERIADSLVRTPEVSGRVVEIGPGQGMLTQFLLKNKYQIVAVEADRDMVSVLNKKFETQLKATETSSLHIVLQDFMQFPLEEAFAEGLPFCLIGNFPYNISSQILIKMIENRDLIPEMVGMFQLEVAERVVAKAGGKEYGILTLLVQAFYNGEMLFHVDKSEFSPPPKVQSAVIRLTRKDSVTLGCDEKFFKTVVKTAFGQRRKMLRNTLRTMFDKDPSVLTEDFFMRRPETLNLQEFVDLTNRIAAL